MAAHWLSLLAGVALLQGIIALSPIPVPDEEWEEFSRMMRDPTYRLPTTTKPRHYEVTLRPFFENATVDREFFFDGSVVIYTSPTESNVNEIVLHCNDLTIFTATVEYTNANNVVQQIVAPNQNFVCEESRSFLRIATTEVLQLNQEYTIRMTFRGNLQSNMRGFYRSWYVDSSGNKRWMATTQFQPSHARQTFPCYDEPGFKATFDITIEREPDFSPSISNMPIRTNGTTADGTRVSETFHTTPYTSTYLLAFIVSHYVLVATNNDPIRPFDIYARDNVGTTGEWSLEIGELLLAEMEAYTDFPYYNMTTYLDMKQAAIPDFSAGAMENWGLLTYREALLLYDPQHSNHFYKQRVANIVSHEITHMWFGNLVTCAWWDNLWLNEGFARFYQYFLTERVAPELGYTTRFVVEQFQMAMASDSVDSAHALTDPSVITPTTVSNHFSTITYARGASIIRMTLHLLGEDTYIKALRIYLKARQFDVAEPHHLFEAFDQAAAEDSALAAYPGMTIDRYFRTWSEKAGHPMLYVSIDQATGRMTITQSRWERTTGQSNQPGLWDIPITWTRANAADFDNLKPSQFITAQVTVIERGTQGNEWVVFNKQSTGFYRINYDDRNWALLTRALRQNPKVIHEYNRAQIIDDLFNLARASVMPYERIFNIISFLEFDDDYAPWISAIDGFTFLLRRLAHDTVRLDEMRAIIRNLSVAVVARLGFSERTGEPFMDGILRMYLMNFLCDIEHQQCITEGRNNFLTFRNAGLTAVNPIPANMRPWVYCTGLRYGTAEDFNFFWARYNAEDLASEQIVMLTAAGCTSDVASLETYLDAIVAGQDIVRGQDHSTALSSAITRNEYNTLRAFSWLQRNIPQTIATLGSVATPLNSIGQRLLNENDLQMFETWLNQNQAAIGTAYNTGVAAANTARNNLAWSARRMPEIVTFIQTGYVEDVIEDPITTAAPTTVTAAPTTLAPTTAAPVTDQPDSANIATLSVVTLLITLAVNLVN